MAPTGFFALALLWVLFFWWYRDYRLDFFRQSLFSLRDELFDIAIEGEIEFEDQAYKMLRSTINGTIQYGHQLGILGLLCSVVFEPKNATQDEIVGQFENRWENACSELEPEICGKLRTIRNRLHILIAEQVIFTSFVLVSTLFALVLVFLLRHVQRFLRRLVHRAMSASKIHQLVATLDCMASMRAKCHG